MVFVVVATRFLLGAVFAISAVEKIRDRRAVRRFVIATVGPDRAIGPSIVGVILGEAAAAALLFSPAAWRWDVPAGFALALVLLGAFSAVLIRALRRDVRVPCGCFGASSGPPNAGHLLRNGVLAAAAAIGLIGSAGGTTAPLSPSSVAVGLLGTAAAFVVVRLDEFKTLFVKRIQGYE